MKHVNLRVHRMFLRIHRMFLPVLVGLCMSVGAYTQQITVTGTVIDQTSLSVIGASVRVKGTTVGTVTDFDGNFSLSASVGIVSNTEELVEHHRYRCHAH